MVQEIHMNEFDRLVDIVKKLRAPEGCPWDRKQTLYSLKDALLEETCELIDALDNKDIENIKEELGDVLLHVVFHSQTACEDGLFNIEDVFFRLIYDIYAGQKFKNIFGKDFIYTNSFNLKSLLDEIDVDDKHFYNHYSIEEFATETGNDINIILAYEVLHKNDYKYMIQENLNHHFNVYKAGKNEFINN